MYSFKRYNRNKWWFKLTHLLRKCSLPFIFQHFITSQLSWYWVKYFLHRALVVSLSVSCFYGLLHSQWLHAVRPQPLPQTQLCLPEFLKDKSNEPILYRGSLKNMSQDSLSQKKTKLSMTQKCFLPILLLVEERGG